MTKDLAAVVTNVSSKASFTYNHSVNHFEESTATSEKLAAQIAQNSANLVHGLGEAFGKTSVGKFLQVVSTGINYVADALVSFVPSLPVASANSIQSPLNSPQIKTVEKLKSQGRKPKIIGKYNLEELSIPDNLIYFDCKNGDWFFSILTLNPLTSFDLKLKFPFTFFVKRATLEELVKTDNYKDFQELTLKARSNILNQINEKHDLFKLLFGRIAREALTTKDHRSLLAATNKIFGFKYFSELELQIKDFVVSQLKKMKSLPKNTLPIYVDNILENEFKNIVTSHLEKLQIADDVKKLWEKTKKQDFSSSEEEYYLLEKYRVMEKANLENEKYFDRIEKFKKLKDDTNFVLILSNKNISQVSNSFINAVSHPFYPKIMWNFFSHNELPEAPQTISHEALHIYDIQTCLAENNGFSVDSFLGNISKIPCSNNPKNDKQLSVKLTKARDLDNARFLRFIDNYNKGKKGGAENIFLLFIKEGYKSNIENIKADVEALDNAFTALELGEIDHNNRVTEIVPHITDNLTPSKFILFCPNIAVVRSKTIHNDGRRETALYMAIMQCDIDSVQNIIKQNPSILNEEYDGIKFHELPKMLVEAGYDKFVDKSFKKDNKNNYADMNGLIEKEHKLYKESNVKKLADKKEQSSKEKEL